MKAKKRKMWKVRKKCEGGGERGAGEGREKKVKSDRMRRDPEQKLNEEEEEREEEPLKCSKQR